jgi:hypothetical protein
MKTPRPGDLRDPRWIIFKGWLFLALGLLAGLLLWLQSPQWQTLLLLAICVWGFCRFYYFLFYVIENYVDSGYRFRGVGDALRYLLRRRE